MGDSYNCSHDQTDGIILLCKVSSYGGDSCGHSWDEDSFDVVLVEGIEDEGEDDDVANIEAVGEE